MSPITITTPEADELEEQDVEALLQDEEGKPTLEAEVIDSFLGFVDWDEVFEDAAVTPHIESVSAYIKNTEDGSDFVEVEEGTEGAEKIDLQQISGDVLSQVIDEDDLLLMFEYYLENLPEDTLEDKARKAIFATYGIGERGMMMSKDKLIYGAGSKGMMPGYSQSAYKKKYGSKHKKKKGMMAYEAGEEDEEDELDEGPFKKGAFKKIHKAGGKGQVARMLIAMMKKQAIVRAPAGKGYKKGDYKKSPAGYGGGTPGGRKRYRAYVKKHKAAISKTAKGARKAAKIAARFTAKAKTKKGAAAKKKKTLAASVSVKTIPGTTISEGASLAGAVMKKMKPPVLTEDK